MSERTHLRASVVLLTLFLAAGVGLEAMLGLRSPDWMEDELRREFLRLGHAHGALLAMLNLVLVSTWARLGVSESWQRVLRPSAWGGALLVGLGFAGGGLVHGPTDPGPLVLLVPAGAFALIGVLLCSAILREGEKLTSNEVS